MNYFLRKPAFYLLLAVVTSAPFFTLNIASSAHQVAMLEQKQKLNFAELKYMNLAMNSAQAGNTAALEEFSASSAEDLAKKFKEKETAVANEDAQNLEALTHHQSTFIWAALIQSGLTLIIVIGYWRLGRKQEKIAELEAEAEFQASREQ